MTTQKLLEWEKTGNIRILNDKETPTRVPGRKGDRANCLDLMIITKGLENRIANYTLDTEHEWSSSATQTKTNISGGTAAYLRGKPTATKFLKSFHFECFQINSNWMANPKMSICLVFII